jgi:hypothetical protein
MKLTGIILFPFLAALMLMHDPAIAQFSVEATITSMYDNNVNNNYLQVSDYVTSSSFGVARDWETESSNTHLFYTGSFNYFSAVTQRTFHAHSFGVTYSTLFDEQNQSLFTIGGTYSFRLNRDGFTFYNNNQFSAYANVKHYLAERVIGRASYSFRSVALSELPDFNYTEHYGFVQGTFFLPTSTTLILEADLGTKIYSTSNYDSTLQSRTHGQGRRVVTSSTPSAMQLIGLARIGQQLMEGTGLSVTTSYQLNLQKESRYLSSEYGTISDDELFDDHYGHEGLQASVMLTQLLPAEMLLRITGSVQNREYSERPAFDLKGNQIANVREDTRNVLTLQFEKRFESIGISFRLSYDYIINRSNDLFYDYTNSAATARLAYTY